MLAHGISFRVQISSSINPFIAAVQHSMAWWCLHQNTWPVFGVQAHIVSVAIVPPVKMCLSSSEQQTLAMYASKVERWGWRWRQCDPQPMSTVLTHFGCVLEATMSAVDLQARLCSGMLKQLFPTQLFVSSS